MSFWGTVDQWFYPRDCRIEAPTAGSIAALLATSLAALAGRPSEVPLGGEPEAGLSPGPAGPNKAFVLDLCNNFHRLARSAGSLQGSENAEAVRVQRNLDQVRKVLRDNGIDCVDLAGQAFDPGRADFEALGEPRPTPGLARKTILQCERPLVLLNGRLLQPAKGIVGRPASE
jgi:hypothetical protein